MRPKIAVDVPTGVHPGDRIEVIVRCDFGLAGRRVKGITVEHAFFEHARLDNGNDIEAERNTKRVFDGGRLAGRHRYVVKFEIPADAPITDTQGTTHAWHSIRVQIELPWVFDARHEEMLIVSPRPAVRGPAEPFVTACTSSPRVEFALADRNYAPGEVIHGAIAISELGDRRASGVEVALVATITEPNTNSTFPFRHEALEAVVFVPIAPEERPGKPHAFALTIPATTTPTQRARRITRRFEVVARIDGRNAEHRAPITVAVFERGSEATPRARETPDVGLPRARRLLAKIAESFDLELHYTRASLSGRVGACAIVISADDEDAGTLQATLSFPSLDLGLRVDSAQFRSSMKIGDDLFRARFSVDARDETQAAEVLGFNLRSALLAFDEAELHDDGATVRKAGAIGDEHAVTRVVERVIALAEALPRDPTRLPPPRAMVTMVDDWARFAEAVGARLHRGDMSLRGGTLDGHSIGISTRFDKKQRLSTELRVELPPDCKTDVLSSEAQQRLMRLHETYGAVTFDESAILMRDPKVTPNPATLVPALRSMIDLARELGARKGPYR